MNEIVQNIKLDVSKINIKITNNINNIDELTDKFETVED